MRLKWVTTFLLVCGLGLLVAWPFVVGARPEQATRRETAEYALRFSGYVMLLFLLFASTTVCAWFLMKQERRKLREQTLANMKDLVEGTLRDHAEKQP